jgi:hypothetical protein
MSASRPLLTEPEKRLVKILELVQIEKHIPVSAKRQWLGRPLQEREAIARAFVAKSVLRYQHTSSLRNELLSTPNLRMICGFTKRQDVPSESTFSRAFSECASADLGTLVHDALVEEHMSAELIGHVSRDSTAIIGREKPAKGAKGAKKPRSQRLPRKEDALPKGRRGHLSNRNGLRRSAASQHQRLSPCCQMSVTVGPRRMPRATRNPGTGSNCTWT